MLFGAVKSWTCCLAYNYLNENQRPRIVFNPERYKYPRNGLQAILWRNLMIRYRIVIGKYDVR